ncbi:hypothetical protein ScPMuIL_017317 [Solemya velum]
MAHVDPVTIVIDITNTRLLQKTQRWKSCGELQSRLSTGLFSSAWVFSNTSRNIFYKMGPKMVRGQKRGEIWANGRSVSSHNQQLSDGAFIIPSDYQQ